jgi:hypothetical protein
MFSASVCASIRAAICCSASVQLDERDPPSRRPTAAACVRADEADEIRTCVAARRCALANQRARAGEPGSAGPRRKLAVEMKLVHPCLGRSEQPAIQPVRQFIPTRMNMGVLAADTMIGRGSQSTQIVQQQRTRARWDDHGLETAPAQLRPDVQPVGCGCEIPALVDPDDIIHCTAVECGEDFLPGRVSQQGDRAGAPALRLLVHRQLVAEQQIVADIIEPDDQQSVVAGIRHRQRVLSRPPFGERAQRARALIA